MGKKKPPSGQNPARRPSGRSPAPRSEGGGRRRKGGSGRRPAPGKAEEPAKAAKDEAEKAGSGKKKKGRGSGRDRKTAQRKGPERPSRESAELRQFLAAEEISDLRKTEVLMELTEGGDELVRNLLRVMVDKNREDEVPATYLAFVELMEEAQGIVHVEVVSAVPLSVSLQKALRAKVEAALRKKVELTMTVDEEVIGGLRLRIGDQVADATVRHRLERLRQLLVSPMTGLEGSVEAAS